MPGYGVMLQMAAQLILESIGTDADVLVLGAGGGLEIESFAERAPGWRFCAVDPDRAMLDAARDRAAACGASARVTWIDGLIFQAPTAPFDAATCLLTLHFIADDGQKVETLKALRARLKPTAPFILADLCMDKGAPDYEVRLGRYRQFALDSGALADQAAAVSERVRCVISSVSAERNEALLSEAGFKGIDLFHAGLSWRGWVAYA